MEPGAPTTLAAFDFDGTLTAHDSVVPFLRRFTTRRRFAAALLPQVMRLLPLAARRDRDELRAVATELVFRGRSASEVRHQALAHAKHIAATDLRDDTVARLRWHLANGHLVVIVSASYEDYLRPVAAEWGGVDVLGTRLEVTDGVCTGRLAGANCRGPEKVRRLEAWLSERALVRGSLDVFAYGDSSGDRDMLAWADHPHRVDEPLASVAPTG